MRNERKSSIELFRIVCIFMIILFHCAYKSGFVFGPGPSGEKFFIGSLWMLGELGMNGFILLSGYFMPDFDIRKVIRVAAQVHFYNLLSLVVGTAVGAWEFPTGRVFFLWLLPVTQGVPWFTTYWLVIYILSPWLKMLADAMDEIMFQKLLAVLVLLFSIIPTAVGMFWGSAESLPYYNRLIWMVVMYFMGAYIRKYGQRKLFFQKGLLFMFIPCTVLALASIPVIDLMCVWTGNPGMLNAAYFWSANSVLMFGMSVGLFCVFLQLRTRQSRTVNRLASMALGVYILHDGKLAEWIWEDLFRCAEWQGSPWLAARILMAAVALFAAGCLCELVRQPLERRVLIPFLDRKLGAVDGPGEA